MWLIKKIRNFQRILLLFKNSSGNNEQFNELVNFPRFTRTKTEIEGREILIPDAASFLSMYEEIFKKKIYQFTTLNSTPFIIDGGANIGLASIYLKLLYPSSEIVAFEPDPEIFKFLKYNLEAFDFDHIELVQKGLWNDNTTIEFKTEGADSGLIVSDKDVSGTETIKTASLKPYLQKQVDFLKLDIEGSETVVLKDVKNNLGKVERIFVEYHSFVGQSQTLNEIIDILTKAGFRLHISSPSLNSKSPFIDLKVYNNMDMQLNIFGFREN